MLNRDTATPKIRVNPPGPNTHAWTKYHLKHGAEATYEAEFVWDRSKPAIGPFCHDPDGNLFLDFASHVSTNALGYNHPEILEVTRKLAEISPDRYAGTDFIGAYGDRPEKSGIPTPSHLHEKLIQITKQFEFDQVFLSNSGTEAVENAIKLSYSTHKGNGYGICFTGAFHGRTLGALSLNRSKRAHRAFYPQIPNIIELPYCSCVGKCVCEWQGERDLNALERLLDPEVGLVYAEEVAYIIIEPIQGEGGYRIPNQSFITEIFSIAKKNHIPIISDEVQMGMGRTGKWWAIEHFGVKPDLISAAKALRVGATIGKVKYFPKQPLRIAGTWSEGNAIASAEGYTTINIIQRDQLLKHATQMGKYFLEGLKRMEKKFSVLKNSRGLGLALAFDLPSSKMQQRVRLGALKNGLLIIGCGTTSMRLLPPLDVRKREVDLALEILAKTLKQIRT